MNLPFDAVFSINCLRPTPFLSDFKRLALVQSETQPVLTGSFIIFNVSLVCSVIEAILADDVSTTVLTRVIFDNQSICR